MGRTGLFRAALLLAALTFGLVATPAGSAGADQPDPPVPPAPLKVLVVGDSITQGFGGDATWRYWFWREADRQGVPIDFVGPDTLPRMGRYESTGLRFDRDHAARVGSTVGFHLRRIDELMVTHRPQVVVVELGINDARHGRTGPEIAADIEALIDRVWAHNLLAKVVLAELPSYPENPVADAVGAQANALLREAFAHHARVVLAENRTATTPRWVPARMTSDGLHPNATGQTLLAQRFAEAFHRAGYLPQQPSAYRVRSWRPGVTVRVRRSGHRLTVDWSASLTEVKFASARVLITRPNGTRLRGRSWFSAGIGQITRTVPRGTWYVRLIPVRGTMQGVAVRATVVRVP